ncbi:TPA: poly-beta-1,6 N-acetyl-D-glucosamine export porin PgaA [Klebsiella pneumoniae]|nr:poly-beta-1,6 N-acetyl-D-glucosamine export porin PgaA [Klebsiella pneumoniae]
MNIWQIEMERSPYSNTLLFNRNTKLSLSIGLLLLFPALVQGADSLYDQQILQARQGQYAPFLSYLQQYQLRHALTPSQVADWLQVALWAGQDDEVVKVWRRYQVYMPIPARGTAAAAQALRNQKQWQTSLTLWQQALSQAPGSDDYRIGYIKTLADARKDGEALSEARRLVAEQASVAHLQTLSYVYLRLGKSWDQLLVDTQILDREPQNKTALARTALTQYDAMIAAWHPDPQAAPDIIRARIDRLGALYASAEYAQVIREYQSLIAQQQTVPDWAIGWVISSFIALKQIEPALTLIHQHPSWLTSQQNEEHELFYALLDTGQYPAAQRYVARLTRNAPYIRRLYGSPTPQPNDDWLTAQSLNVHYLAATNDLPQAEARMQRLAATAPGNQGLQIDYAALLQERGLPRAAERQLKAAESLEPASLQLERQQAWVALDLQEWRQMDLLADDVVARSPRDLNTQRLARAREIHHLSELRLSVGKGLHSDNPVSGTHDLSFETAIYSPPLADSWRLFGGHRFAEGNFEEGKGSRRQLFAGIEWRPRDYWGELELSSVNFHGENKPGVRLSAAHDVSDRWQLGGELERISQQTPLRALRNGVSANRGEGWLRWSPNERREYRFSAAASRFTDRNRRQEYTLSGKERLWQTPWLTLDLQPGLSASANSRTDTAYYSPARDLAATAALAVDHTLYQRYDTVWSQQLLAGGGSYWQKNHAAGAITVLGYGQRLRWNNVVDTGLMLNWDKRPYDSKRENNLAITLDANIRF